MTTIDPRAKDELNDAALYYESCSRGLGEKFLTDFENTLALIEEFPKTWADYIPGVKKLNFRFFPFSILYTYDPTNDVIGIVAIQHHRRMPFYWKNRL